MRKKCFLFLLILLFLFMMSGYSEKSDLVIKRKAVRIYKNKKGQTEAEFKYGIKMVYVKGGEFLMGQSDEEREWLIKKFGMNKYKLFYKDEKPQHKVYVKSFWIGKYEVTQKIWKAIMGNNPSHFKGDNLPLEKVSWNDVQNFLKKLNEKTGLNFRLPTEAEWEYASRGGNLSRGYKYSGSNNPDEVGWYWRNSGDNYLKGDWSFEKNNNKTHPVGMKKPNELGIYDMSGNVWEWCGDWYDKNYYSKSPYKNPEGPSSGSHRIERGGSWNYGARFMYCIVRLSLKPSYRSGDLGFRLVLYSVD